MGMDYLVFSPAMLDAMLLAEGTQCHALNVNYRGGPVSREAASALAAPGGH